MTELLLDCVEGGASVGFMRPLMRDRGLPLALPENQPPRAELAKMLVHRDARRRGIAQRLLAAEREAPRRAHVRDHVLLQPLATRGSE